MGLLQDHQFTPDVTRHLRKMKATQQTEAIELMIAANTIIAAHEDALLKATPPEQPKGDPLEQIVRSRKSTNTLMKITGLSF